MRELTLILDDLRGEIVVEDNQDLSAEAVKHLEENLGEAQSIACARPLQIIEPPADSFKKETDEISVRVAGFYHNSLTEGPGRRSSVLFQFCPLKCLGCYVPELHDKNAGVSVPVKKLAASLLDPQHERDGVTILGGEPFAQILGLRALIQELRKSGCPHIVCYSGYTLEALSEKAVKQSAIGEVLDEIDILIDGAYVESQAAGAGLWTGSGNQRVIDMRATNQNSRVILYS